MPQPSSLSLKIAASLLVFSAIHLQGGTSPLPSWDCGVPEGAATIELSAGGAAPTKMVFAGTEIPLSGGGGFIVQDFNAKKDVSFEGGKISQEGGAWKYSAEGDGLALRADFTSKDGSIRVTGEIENKAGGDRPVIVRYIVPVPAIGTAFENGLGASETITAQSKALGTVIPVAAMTGQNWGVGLAIPPTAPCCFGMTGSSKGLGVEFYLGISPLPKKFPNKASFSFVITAALPGSGFRSALAQYYKSYAEYYNAPFAGSGGYLWNEKLTVAEALPLYKIECIGHSDPAIKMAVERHKLCPELITTEDIGATGRSVRDLPEMPTDYDSAIKAFAAYKVVWDKMGPAAQQKKYSQFHFKDVVNIIERCVIENAEGKKVLTLRDISWSPKSIAFTTNPNPWLFQDKGVDTVGSTMVKAAADYLKNDEGVEGTLVDSLGANFPARLNYRQDHYPYEQYPLTFDAQGRVVIHNMISHYELMQQLRATAHAMGKFSTANGVYPYPGRTEGYNSQRTGRFFIAALLDEATRECSRVLTRDEFTFGRVAMGRKLYNVAVHQWTNEADVRKQLNLSIPFTAFSMPEGERTYLSDPKGYPRDKELLGWFAKNARILAEAGWQPVTHATVSDPVNIACERYGSAPENYLSLVNFSDQPVETDVAIDLKGLNIAGKPVVVTEIAQNIAVTPETSGDICHVKITLDPAKACILKVAARR